MKTEEKFGTETKTTLWIGTQEEAPAYRKSVMEDAAEKIVRHGGRAIDYVVIMEDTIGPWSELRGMLWDQRTGAIELQEALRTKGLEFKVDYLCGLGSNRELDESVRIKTKIREDAKVTVEDVHKADRVYEYYAFAAYALRKSSKGGEQ